METGLLHNCGKNCQKFTCSKLWVTEIRLGEWETDQ